MYTYAYEVQSKKPEAIISFDALTYPFDKTIWYLIASSTAAVFLTLIGIQTTWIRVSGERPPIGWVFQGGVKVP